MFLKKKTSKMRKTNFENYKSAILLERVFSCLEVYLSRYTYTMHERGWMLGWRRVVYSCCRYNVIWLRCLGMLDNITYWGVVALWVLNVPSQIIEHKNASITDTLTDDSLVYLSCRYHTHTRFTIYMKSVVCWHTQWLIHTNVLVHTLTFTSIVLCMNAFTQYPQGVSWVYNIYIQSDAGVVSSMATGCRP